MHSREHSAQKAGDMKKHGMFEALQIFVTAIASSPEEEGKEGN